MAKSKSTVHATEFAQGQIHTKAMTKSVIITRLVVPTFEKKSTPVYSIVNATSQATNESPENFLRMASKNGKKCKKYSPELSKNVALHVELYQVF